MYYTHTLSFFLRKELLSLVNYLNPSFTYNKEIIGKHLHIHTCDCERD